MGGAIETGEWMCCELSLGNLCHWIEQGRHPRHLLVRFVYPISGLDIATEATLHAPVVQCAPYAARVAWQEDEGCSWNMQVLKETHDLVPGNRMDYRLHIELTDLALRSSTERVLLASLPIKTKVVGKYRIYGYLMRALDQNRDAIPCIEATEYVMRVGQPPALYSFSNLVPASGP